MARRECWCCAFLCCECDWMFVFIKLGREVVFVAFILYSSYNGSSSELWLCVQYAYGHGTLGSAELILCCTPCCFCGSCIVVAKKVDAVCGDCVADRCGWWRYIC